MHITQHPVDEVAPTVQALPRETQAGELTIPLRRRQVVVSSDLNCLGNDLTKYGWAPVSEQDWGLAPRAAASMQQIWEQSPPDPRGGNRHRLQRSGILDIEERRVRFSRERGYIQYKNQEYSGVRREIELIPDGNLTTETMESILSRAIEIVLTVDDELSAARETARVGLHAIRYQVEGDEVAVSSPPWMHIDDERYVFVVLVDRQGGEGGVNLFASPGEKAPTSARRLERPLDAVLLGPGCRHAVTPLTAGPAGARATRDVLLITVD